MKGLHYDETEKKIRTTSDCILSILHEEKVRSDNEDEQARSREHVFADLRKPQVVALQGGNIYAEMIKSDEFAEATIGHEDSETGRQAALRVKRIFDSRNFHTSLCSDRRGVELAGALGEDEDLSGGAARAGAGRGDLEF